MFIGTISFIQLVYSYPHRCAPSLSNNITDFRFRNCRKVLVFVSSQVKNKMMDTNVVSCGPSVVKTKFCLDDSAGRNITKECPKGHRSLYQRSWQSIVVEIVKSQDAVQSDSLS